MIFEEYCSYILSRESDSNEFTIPGSSVTIEKSELLNNMKLVLRDNGDKDYDSLLLNTLLCYVSKDYLGRTHKFDDDMDSVINNIRKRVEQINNLYNSIERPFPFSYERIFEILVYYLRIMTNILNSGKEQKVCYVTADITPEAVIHVLNHKLRLKNLDEEWAKKGWEVFYKERKPLSASMVDNYLKSILLATYIRYCEIKDV